MANILPDILETDPNIFQDRLEKALIFSTRIHIDIIDSSYCDNPSLFPQEWKLFPKNSQVSVHIMVAKPMALIDECLSKGAKQLIVEIEDCHQQALVTYCKHKHISIGLAVDLPTSLNRLDIKVLPHISSILLMSVKAGKSGQVFDETVLPKIRQLRQICGENTEIMVDGGINTETGKVCLKAGADTLVVNTFFWKDPEKNWRLLQQLG